MYESQLGKSQKTERRKDSNLLDAQSVKVKEGSPSPRNPFASRRVSVASSKALNESGVQDSNAL